MKLINILLLVSTLSLAACSDGDDDNSSNPSEVSTETDNTSGGNVSEWKSGKITTYAESGNPFPMEQTVTMEPGYYKCAPAVAVITDFVYGSCYEVKYGDNVMRFIGTDYCPDGDNTTIDIYTDAVFQQLTGQSYTKLDMQYREIPYYTDNNLVLSVKDGSNNWFLGCRVYNGRYPVTGVAISWDGGNTYHDMTAHQYCEFFELQVPDGSTFTGTLTVKVTDKYKHTVVGIASQFSDGALNDLGSNFEY